MGEGGGVSRSGHDLPDLSSLCDVAGTIERAVQIPPALCWDSFPQPVLSLVPVGKTIRSLSNLRLN